MFSNNSRSLRYSTIFLLPPQNFLRAHISRLGKGEAAARHKPVEETRFSSERVARFLMRATRRGRDVITWPGIPSVCHSLQREASRRQRWPELLPSVFSTENTEPERRLSTTPQRIPTERCLLPFIATSGSGSQFNPLQEEFFFERRRTSIWKWNSATEMNVFVSRVIIESLDGIPFDRIRRGYTNLGTAENLSDDRIWKSSFPDKLIRPLSTVLWNLSIGRRGTREGFVNFQCLLWCCWNDWSGGMRLLFGDPI